VVHVISRRRGGPGLLFTSAAIKEEHRGEFNQLIKQTANFFKHARNDHDASIEFNVTLSLSFIVMCLIGLIQMGETLNDTESIFFVWARIHRPNWFTDSLSDYGVPAEAAGQLRTLNRGELFEAVMQMRRATAGPPKP
jgi:hypothetical protein